MSLIDVLYGDYPKIQDHDRKDLRYVRFADDKLYCWYIKMWHPDKFASTLESFFVSIPVIRISVPVLKRIGVWELLSADVQQDIIDAPIESIKSISEEIEPVKRGRRSRAEYADLPREISCSKCGRNPTYIAPSVLIVKAELEGLEGSYRQEKLQEYLDNYQCSTCNPRRRGRARNPLYKDIPRSTPCATCGKDCTLNSKNVYELTNGDVDAINKYCSEYLCRSCNPEWGSWLKGKGRRGRKCKPENEGFPKKATCSVCSREVSITPDNIRGKAKKMGITVEELLANYKCRKCGGMIRGKKK